MPVTANIFAQSQISIGDASMSKDKRRLLDVLRHELEFVEKGGYRRPSRAAWRPQFMFQDSPTCLNFKSIDHPAPCTDCVMMQLVPADSQQRKFPCRYIPLNERGETLDLLYRAGTQEETETTFKNWLKSTIARLEREQAGNPVLPDKPIEIHVQGKWVTN
jgi:hypothetical protein